MRSVGDSNRYKEIVHNLDEMEKTLNKGVAVDIGFIRIFSADIAQLKDGDLRSKLSSRFTELTARVYELTLEVMEKTVQRGEAVDIGTIEIFSDDIEAIKDKKLHDKLSHRLNTLASRIYDLSEGQLVTARPEDSFRPLVGETTELKQFATELSKGPVRSRLEKLDSSFTMRPIAGDGHCLFRAITVGILEFIQSVPAAKQKDLLNKIAAKVDELKKTNTELEKSFKIVKNFIDDILTGRRTLATVLTNRQTSDQFVHFLRELATTYNEVNSNDTLEAEALASGEKSTKEYLKKMRDMDAKTLAVGGQPELLALMKTLDIDLIVLNATSEEIDNTDPQTYLNRAKDNKPALFLLLRPGHYDLAQARAKT